MTVETEPTQADAELVNRLLGIISKEGLVPAEKLSFDASLDTLGVQSADVVVILLAIEEEFKVYIPVDSELSEMKTVGDLVRALAKHIAANCPSS
jgi:acyl carrier protein